MKYEDFILNNLGKDIGSKLLNELEKDSYRAIKTNSIIGCPDSIFSNLNKHEFVNNAYLFDKNSNPLGKSIYHAAGCFYIQEPSAMLVSELLPINETDVVLDLCGAPGGKLTSIAPKLSKGVIIGNEINSKRVLDLKENVERLGLSNVYITNENVDNLVNKFEGYFDKIILDAPCSGEGMFRKNTFALEDWSIDKVYKQSSIQKDLILKAYRMLKKDGLMIFSTCTFNTFENEDTIKYLLENTNASLINLPENGKFNRGINLNEAIRLFPFNYQGEGHFICLIKCNDDHNLSNIFLKERSYIDDKSYSIFKKFVNETLYFEFDKNRLFLTNNHLYYLPEIRLDLSKLNVIKYGLYLGEFIKDNFIPSHHISHSLFKYFKNEIDLDETKIKDYLEGQSFKVNNSNGFYLVSYNTYPLGMCKVANNILKNYYPKNLRRNF